ncbi:ABC transporter ATP-binding protein [Mycoplasma sp. Ms02]|uniref:ABC transporter ATP-binding protein n=1 Tax=Mycoplasma sp. Ms02 TaxID=353851 RepID=UPI001C898F38|nr:ABC transporter ATP-binding protein [Mycoplasma sp. Ms02]QZE12464.1 ABC transporter ATP-binding protein/permease [Mycoplasma sp. Ms02]
MLLKTLRLLPRKVKIISWLSIFLVTIDVIITLVLPLFFSRFIVLMSERDKPITSVEVWGHKFWEGPRDYVFNSLVTFVVLMIVFKILINAIQIYTTSWASEKSCEHIRSILFAKIQKMSLKNISKFGSASLITRVSSDISAFWEFWLNVTGSLIRGGLLVIFSVIFSLITDLTLSMSLLFVIPIMILTIFYVTKRTRPLMVRNRQTIDALTHDVNENITGAKIIKIYNLQEQRQDRYNDLTQNWVKRQITTNAVVSIGEPVFFVLINIVIVVIYILGGFSIVSNNVDPKFLGNIMIFIEYTFNVTLGVVLLSEVLIATFRAKVSTTRINAVLDMHVEHLFTGKNEQITSKNNGLDLEFRDVSFKYHSKAKENAIENISFALKAGEVLGIIGPTGSGKSTIANLMLNNYKYLQGSIKIDQKEIRDIDQKDFYKNVGIVYQEALLYKGTIESNIKFANPEITHEEMQKAFKNSCAWDFINVFEDKEKHEVEQRGKNLSGGQKQRLSIARSLAINPKVLVLDDSTSALDNITTKRVLNNIKEKYQCTTVIISQKVGAIKNADKILVLENGKVTGLGTHEELIQSNDWYKQINLNQLEQ